jgi:hypothetical protein
LLQTGSALDFATIPGAGASYNQQYNCGLQQPRELGVNAQ